MLWINLGKHFNGDPFDSPSNGSYFATGNYTNDPNDPEIIPEIAPSNIPYFVIYNRYRGTLRLFANVWQDNLNPSFQRIAVTMGYTEDSEYDQKITGLFRHASQIDRALNQTTEFTQMIGPRLQPVNSSDWMVAEFQMAFDPCICMKEFNGLKDPGRIEFVFETIETLEIDMLSRTIETENAIDSALINEDFLNLSQFDSINYQPGTRMYSSLQKMLNAYQKELEMYNDSLDDYDGGRNEIVGDLIELGDEFVTQGITAAITALLTGSGVGAAATAVIVQSSTSGGKDSTNLSKGLKDLIKGIVGLGVDQLSMEIYGKEPTKPTKPTQPVANFSETNYKGTITKTFYQRTPPLLVPGGIGAHEPTPDNYMGYGKMRLSPRIFPAYNKVLGQAALLETLQPSIFADAYFSYPDTLPTEVEGMNFDFKLKFDSLIRIALNRSLDFDLDQTNTFVNVELILENRNLEAASEGDFTTSLVNSNMYRTHALPQEDYIIQYQYNSKWIPLEKLNQYVFSLHIRDTYGDGFNNITAYPDIFLHKFKSLKIKLMHDMYFDQINSWDQQNNVAQVHTYIIYNTETPLPAYMFPGIFTASEDSLSEYIAGNVLIADEAITVDHPLVNSISGDTIFINGEDISLTGSVGVQSGYILVLQALGQINISPDANLSNNIQLRIKRDFYDTPVFEYTDNSEVYNFCNDSNQYQSNVASAALIRKIENNIVEDLNVQVKSNKIENNFTIHPNPAKNEIWIISSDVSISKIQIFDLSGRVLLQKNTGSEDIKKVAVNIDELQSGVYIVQIQCGNLMASEKLVVGK